MLNSIIRDIRKQLALALDGPRFKQQRLMKSPKLGTLAERVDLDAFERPHYAYGLWKAGHQAKALGIKAICAIEFGVAGGNGLLAMEQLAEQIGNELGIEIKTIGFDAGEGLPPPSDFRDLPYAWRAGQFKIDLPALEARLKRSELVIGDVAKTVTPFMARTDIPPVGFVALDLDYYSSSVAALKLFETKDYARLLPRSFVYLDDCIGPDHELHCEYVGELLAVAEFNQRHQDRKLAPIHGLRHKRPIPAPWNDVMYVAHLFRHPLYGQYLEVNFDMKLALE